MSGNNKTSVQPCVIKDFHLLLQYCQHLCCQCHGLYCTEVRQKGCTSTRGEAALTAPKPSQENSAPLPWDADPWCSTTKAQRLNIWSQSTRRAQQELQKTSLVWYKITELLQISAKPGAFQRDLSWQRAPAQLYWDHTQQNPAGDSFPKRALAKVVFVW